MDILRMAVGVILFAASSWLSPFISESFGIPETLAFLSVGGILSFAGGIIFYSGVRSCTYSYRS
ncbi:MAG: hypothetical protein E7Z62_02930 [Thermoplasmata archaeon]|nr:hypothetical protein [Thermoplasmata archaeon]MBE6523890.1 hypothetical protein [Thermoplasmata archaeon]